MAATPEPLEPIKNTCERGKGREQEGRELLTSLYIILSHSRTSWSWDLWQPCLAQSRALGGKTGELLVGILGHWQGFLPAVCKDGLYASGVHTALDE